MIIAHLLNIFLKLHPTCRFFPLPTATLDLPVQINLNYLQVVRPKISAELIGAFMVLMLSTWSHWVRRKEDGGRGSRPSPLRESPWSKNKRILIITNFALSTYRKVSDFKSPSKYTPHTPPRSTFITPPPPKFWGHKTLLGFWGQWVSLNKSP